MQSSVRLPMVTATRCAPPIIGARIGKSGWKWRNGGAIIWTSCARGLAFGQLEHDRQPQRIDQRVYFGRQAAARATHEGGSDHLFLTLAACWRTRIDELLIIWISPS